ncbi:PREDICTED: uncharacterized protein LOC109591560 [Amphimedon queenslandica]|nr:PREDICTED: uncharacterized protein LOC109591560 [Amphimedon queenslandica]|eukprot:XP_019862834.1 PREDICTED: uncharacterized protein LOC109591560 [Amphimedon queenslandica]
MNNYTCNCTGTGYQGINCSVSLPSSVASPTPAVSPSVVLINTVTPNLFPSSSSDVTTAPVTLIIVIIAIVIGLLLLLIIGGLIAFSVYSYATKGKRKTFPLKERIGWRKKPEIV